MKRTFSPMIALLLTFGAFPIGACTTAVASGSATTDGRPILWKNRDSDRRLNQVVYAADGKYAYLGLADKGDVAGMEIWAGVNAAGFAIMNSASYNLEKEDTQGEGRFMKLALQSCADVAEFQALLEKTGTGGRDTSANFGVFDAGGTAAVFETGRKGFRRIDATDSKEAPGGLLLRTNYSTTGEGDAGTGFWRMRRARRIAEKLLRGGGLEVGSVLGRLARDLGNDALGTDPAAGPTAGVTWAYTGDSICRFDTTACVVIEGVKPGEDPLLSTLWVILGQPLAGVAVPLWVAAASVPPSLGGTAEVAPAAKAIESLCGELYPGARGDLERYLDAGALAGRLAEMSPEVARADAKNFERARASLEAWSRTPATRDEMRKVQEEIARQTQEVLDGMVLRFARKGAAENPRTKAVGASEAAGGPPRTACGP